jgi:hypothetical protein
VFGLASVVVVIRMAVTPIPVDSLLLHRDFEEWTVVPVPLDEIPAVDPVFVVLPIVIILVIPVIDAVAIIIVTPVFRLPTVVLPRSRVTHRGWH